jgi:uncharacterized membrane protein YheB (UPF0754 family)
VVVFAGLSGLGWRLQEQILRQENLMPELLGYLLVPLLTGLIGWSTNWVGVRIMLYPAEFKGIWYIGWQGIIPRLRVRLTRGLVQHSIAEVCTPADMLQAVDDADAIFEISRLIYPDMEDWLDELLSKQYGAYWNLAPTLVRRQVFAMMRKQVPDFAESLLEEIRKRADEFINIEDIAAAEAERRPDVLTKVLLGMAQQEMRFIIRSGLYIGIPLGCIQAVAWYLYPNSLVLPLFGLLVGAFTNWLALKILMHPSRPVRFMGFTFQGLFIARQQEVAVDFTRIFTENFLTIRQVIQFVWNGERKDEVRKMVKRQFRRTAEKKFFTASLYRLLKIRGDIDEMAGEAIDGAEDRLLPHLERDDISTRLLSPVNGLLTRRISELSPQRYQQLLLPLVKQDEWIVVTVGAVLGFFAGTAQLVFLFGGSLMGG